MNEKLGQAQNVPSFLYSDSFGDERSEFKINKNASSKIVHP